MTGLRDIKEIYLNAKKGDPEAWKTLSWSASRNHTARVALNLLESKGIVPVNPHQPEKKRFSLPFIGKITTIISSRLYGDIYKESDSDGV